MDIINNITKMFDIPCSYTHNHCRLIANRIMELHQKKIEVTNTFFSSYLTYLDKGERNYYYDKCSNKKDIYMPPLLEILKYITPTETDLNLIASFFTKSLYPYLISLENCYEDYQKQIYELLIKREIKLPTSMLLTTIKNRNINGTMMLVNYINPDAKCLEEACLCPDSDKLINLIISQKIPITITAIKNAISVKNDNVVNLLMQIGVTPDIECLKEACRTLNLKIVNSILMCKVSPTSECIKSLLISCSFGYYKIKEDSKAKLVAEIIDCLVLFGYVLTYDDVYNALCKGCYVNNIKRFNIQFDSKFLEQCTRLSYYPYNDIGLKPTMDCLYIESKRIGNVQSMKKLISQGLEPDIKCLIQACDNKTNIQNIKYLVETHNIQPNIECLKTISKHIGNNTLTYLLDHFFFENKSNPKISKNNKNIKKSAVIEKQLEPENDNSEIIIKSEDEINQENIDPIHEAKNRVDSMLKKVSMLNKAQEQLIRNKKIEKKLNVIIENDMDDMDDIDEIKDKVYEIVLIDSIDVQKVNKRNKYFPNMNTVKLFNIDKANKLGFLDARKLLLNYIKKNKLVDEEKNNLIRVDELLSKLLKLKKNQYFDFKYIDNVVCKMLKII